MLVTSACLEHELRLIESQTKDSRAGVFGPNSLEWKVNGESAIFLGAGRALLLQLAHPFVATAVAEHSRVLADPVGRFHRTFQLVFTLVFGTLEQSLHAARQLYYRHNAISGRMLEDIGPFVKGTGYFATNAEALLWVHATLVETALTARDLILAPLTETEREAYYAESCLMAGLFGIPRRILPPDWKAFVAYIGAMHGSDVLTVGSAAKAIAEHLIERTYVPSWYWTLTGQLLPPRLRKAFELEYSETSMDAARLVLNGIKRVYPLLPRRLRQVGPLQEAQARMQGRATPNLRTQLFNNVWIGRGSLPN
jgi:uncharacterized protein (DUF2236 family)